MRKSPKFYSGDCWSDKNSQGKQSHSDRGSPYCPSDTLPNEEPACVGVKPDWLYYEEHGWKQSCLPSLILYWPMSLNLRHFSFLEQEPSTPSTPAQALLSKNSSSTVQSSRHSWGGLWERILPFCFSLIYGEVPKNPEQLMVNKLLHELWLALYTREATFHSGHQLHVFGTVY